MLNPAMLRVVYFLIIACHFKRVSPLWWSSRTSVSSSSSSSYVVKSCVQRCFNGGVCYDTNKCRCTSHYTGYACQNAICNPACHAHGNCIRPNKCQCSTGYEGQLCESAICSPRCQNGGICTNPGECTCSHQYTGGACEQAICQHTCLNRGKCTSPDHCTCAAGYAGAVCENAICTKPCLNGGSCIAPDLCACAPSYLGTVCELGGDPTSFLTPSHNFADERTGQPLSWYEEEPLSTFGKFCLVKVEILNADIETLLTATSYTSSGTFLGNYTVGGADAGLRSNGSDRAACLEFRCPSDLNGDSIVVNITITTSHQNCFVANQSSLVNDQTGRERSGKKEMTFHAEPYRDYGSKYGIYITYGVLEKMKYTGEHMCRSGTNGGGDGIVSHDGTAVTYTCG